MRLFIAGSFTMTRHGHTADIERLLDRGIPVNVRDPYGSALLVIAWLILRREVRGTL